MLIGEDGANLIKINRSTPIAFIAKGEYWVNNHAHVIDAVDTVVLEYLAIYINSIDLTLYVTMTAQPKMNQAKLNSIPVAFPPKNEQKRILENINLMEKFCNELQQQIEEKNKRAKQLRQAALHEVSAGKKES